MPTAAPSEEDEDVLAGLTSEERTVVNAAFNLIEDLLEDKELANDIIGSALCGIEGHVKEHRRH